MDKADGWRLFKKDRAAQLVPLFHGARVPIRGPTAPR